MSGYIHLFDLMNHGQPSSTIPTVNPRPCNGLSFNSDNYLAVGFDKARNDCSLQIFDISHDLRNPKYQSFAGDVVSSLSFVPNHPQTLICGGYKMIKEVDLRSDKYKYGVGEAAQLATKYVNNIVFDPLNDACFCAAADDGSVSFWDRRNLKIKTEPLLVLNPLGEGKKSQTLKLRLSTTRRGEFSVLQDGLLKRWQNGYVPENEYMFVKSVTQTSAEPYSVYNSNEDDSKSDKVVCFDYVKDIQTPKNVSFVCIRQSGEIFRKSVRDSPSSINFDVYNTFSAVDPDNVSFLVPQSDKAYFAPRIRSDSQYTSDTLEEYLEPNPISSEYLLDPATVLAQDISTTMRQLAVKGYGTDPEYNRDIFISPNTHPNRETLRVVWRWLQLASSREIYHDGVLNIWRSPTIPDTRDLSSKPVFTQFISMNETKRVLRQICLKVSGWTYDLDQLEEKIVELEDIQQYEKAAGLALFHGNLNRAVKALRRSNSEIHLLMCAALAGNPSTTSKEICRRLADDLENPYSQAIFAYVSDPEWLDVLDTCHLPLHERLGIALRFFDDNKLSNYLSHLAQTVVRAGDLDGIILTGTKSQLGHALIQSYVDKTGDVQTAALITNSPQWTMPYRELLHHWKLFGVRAMFDVYSRAKTMPVVDKAPPPQSSLLVPPQVILCCNACNKQILPTANVNGRCPHCKHPMPRCAVCLVPFTENWRSTKSDRWFTFCLSCQHGMHAEHAREWFGKHEICAVPECSCKCRWE